jgi:outer membrane murein-binding lipoprotein Lpp
MGPSQPARRVTHDRARRNPVVRPDYLQIYKLKAGPDAQPEAEAEPASADAAAPQPKRPRATRAFLIAIITAVAVNSGALIGLMGWGVLQALGLTAEPAIETVQREHAASISQLDATVQALTASVMGLSAHVNATGDRDEATNRRLAEFNERLGVMRSGLNEIRAAQAAEPWRQPIEDLTASVAKVRGDVTGLRASLDELKPRPPAANVSARLDRIEHAMIAHNLLGPMRGAIEPEGRPAARAGREEPPATDGHIISLTPAQ